MRVLYIFRSLAAWGGIERVLIDKMNYFSQTCGIDVFMLTYDQGSHHIPYRVAKNVTIIDLNICFYRQYNYNIFKRLLIAQRMKRRYNSLLFDYIKDVRPDIIICTTAECLEPIINNKRDIPLIVECHSIYSRSVPDGRYEFLRFFRKQKFLRCLLKVDTLISLTERDAEDWKKKHHHVVVIPNMVHLNQGSVSTLENHRVIFVGRFDYQKRVQDAIRIWSLINKKFPNWSLDIYGEGEMQKEITELASDVLGVCVHAPTNKIFEKYQESSILISTSSFEPFGLVIVEAMSCGLPVVSYDNYGPSSIITDGVDGFLVKNNDALSFVDKLCLLMDSVVLRKTMGAAAVVSSKRYSPDYIMPLWLDLLSHFSR